MAEQGAVRDGGWLHLAREMDPFRATWRLFTNVRWAIGIITFLALASLLGVVVPQVPANVRGDATAEAQWLVFQEGRFGFATDVMNNLGLFDIFHARWFIYALGLLVVSISVCTASRLPGRTTSPPFSRRMMPGRARVRGVCVIRSVFLGPFQERLRGTRVQGAIEQDELTRRIEEILE